MTKDPETTEPQEPEEEVQATAAEEVNVEEEEEETLEQWRERALRAQADIQNMRKRMIRDVEDRTRSRTEALLTEFITLQDHLGFALDSMPEHLEKDENAGPFAIGVRAIHGSMGMLLNRFGAESIVPKETDAFDPERHEAIQSTECEDLDEPKLELVRAGWKMGKRILRPAQVRLQTPPKTSEPSEE